MLNWVLPMTLTFCATTDPVGIAVPLLPVSVKLAWGKYRFPANTAPELPTMFAASVFRGSCINSKPEYKPLVGADKFSDTLPTKFSAL